MLNLEKSTRLFDALQYCNKHTVGIEIMDKFVEFNEGVFNTRHIIAMTKCKRDWALNMALHYI